MPYSIYEISEGNEVLGYQVGKSDGKKMSNGRRFASNKPLSYERAEKQMKALYANENKDKNTLKFKIKKVNEKGEVGYKICCEGSDKRKHNPKKIYKKREEAAAAVQLLEGNRDI